MERGGREPGREKLDSQGRIRQLPTVTVREHALASGGDKKKQQNMEDKEIENVNFSRQNPNLKSFRPLREEIEIHKELSVKAEVYWFKKL